ncbi:hypothetical protein FACS1894200_08890 [Spirochaetia bacterium]|nr:hypothetical protein FACS1894200_08890 [Spirochaetia bacterium]
MFLLCKSGATINPVTIQHDNAQNYAGEDYELVTHLTQRLINSDSASTDSLMVRTNY